ncbi:unnamed protein product [Ceratitis capitata]|uniref:(Mediterranean fruit fly) hypothetical protein n=1 Tax=Ceratitis capitata TaxID=7213 RepID=A0A811US89_CERCA|nr:unnamed protein product [Ceratitis capitata]
MRLLMQQPSETNGLLCSAVKPFPRRLSSDANPANLNHATGLIKIRDYVGRWLPERLLFESGRVNHQRFTGENCNGSFMASHSRNVPIGSPIHEAWKNIHFSRDGRDGPSNVHRYPKRSARNSYDSQNSIRLAEDKNVHALSFIWITETDHFTIAINIKQPPVVLNERAFLSSASFLLDPLELLASTTIKSQIWFQVDWASDVCWDYPVLEPIASYWFEHRSEIWQLADLKIDR